MALRFARIYQLQRDGAAFDTPQQLLHALGLLNETQTSAQDYMAVRVAHVHACAASVQVGRL